MPTTSVSPPAPPIPSSSPASEGSGECDGDALGVANMRRTVATPACAG